MKTIWKMLLCALLAVCLLLGLCACGKGLEGAYSLSSITYPDGTTLAGMELQAEMEDVWGMELSDAYLTLHADGTGVLCLYGIDQEIGYEDGKFWYTTDLESGLYIDEGVLEFDEEGFPIEDTTPAKEAEPTVPDDIKLDFTVDGKTITLDPEGFGQVMTFTKK